MKKKNVKVATYLDTPSSMEVVVYDTKSDKIVAIFTDAALASIFVSAVSKKTIEKYGVNWQSIKDFDFQFAVEELYDSYGMEL